MVTYLDLFIWLRSNFHNMSLAVACLLFLYLAYFCILVKTGTRLFSITFIRKPTNRFHCELTTFS